MKKLRELKVTGQQCEKCQCANCKKRNGVVECFKCDDKTCLYMEKRPCRQQDLEQWRKDTLRNEFGKNPEVVFPKCESLEYSNKTMKMF